MSLSPGHRGPSLPGGAGRGAFTSAWRGGGVLPTLPAKPACMPHPCLSAKTCQATIDSLCGNKSSGRVAAWVVGVGQPWQSDSCGTQHCQFPVPAHICAPCHCKVTSPNTATPFLMLMFHNDSFTRCDSHHRMPPPPLLGFPPQAPVSWDSLRMEPAGGQTPLLPATKVSGPQVADLDLDLFPLKTSSRRCPRRLHLLTFCLITLQQSSSCS